MKKLLLIFALLSAPVIAQNVRYDQPFPSVSSTTTTPFLVANVPPNSPLLSVCHSPANQVPCTNYATTYNSLGVACVNGSQDTPQPQPSNCQSTGDAQGNIGFWAPPGKYDYTVCISGTTSCFGPYTVTLSSTTGATLSLQVNSTPNASQSTLNLVDSAGINVVDDGGGAVEFDLTIPSFASGCILQAVAGDAANGAIDCVPQVSYNVGFGALEASFITPKSGTYCWQGSATGSGCIEAQAAASSPSLLWPTGSGTLAVSASSPLVLNPSTGNLTCPTCTGAGSSFEVNTAPLSSSTTINFENSAAFNGLTATFSNPSAGNIQLGFSGQLGNGGLLNSSITVNGQTISLGGNGTIPFQTNATPNTSQVGINHITSSTNAIGLIATPSNPSSNSERIEITGTVSPQGGGTGVDTSSATGVPQVLSGTWSVSTALANGTTATTQSPGDNTTKVATTAYVIANTGAGTVTNIATSPPITGGPITSTGTIACGTCVTSAAGLGTNQLVYGTAGTQATATGNGDFTYTTHTLASDASGLVDFSAITGANGFKVSAINCGVASSVSCVITGNGSTSGTATMTWPAIAGTATNPISISNSLQIPSGTVYNWNADTGLSRDSAGVIDVGNGTAGNESGSINLATLSASGQITSTVTTGTAPFVVASNTVVTNLHAANADLFAGFTWASPNAIGVLTPNIGAFTTLSSNGGLTISSGGAAITGNITGVTGITASGSITAGAGLLYTWNGRSKMSSPSDGVILVSNSAATSFTRLDFGGTTSSFVALGYSGTTLTLTLGDGTAGGTLAASTINAITGYNANGTAGLSSSGVICSGTFTSVEGLVTACTAVSDARLKTQIKPFRSGLAAILQLHPSLYHMNPEGQKITGLDANVEQAGFIAQDVRQAIPAAVGIETEDGTDYLTVKDRPIIAALVNAIHEQQAEIEQLKSELEARP